MAYTFQLSALISATLIGSTFILLMVSNAFIQWSEYGNDENGVVYGLWRYCIAIDSNRTCDLLLCPSESLDPDFCNMILVARTFLTLACILSCVAGTLWVLFCAVIVDSTPRGLLFVNQFLAFASLVTGILGVIVGIVATVEKQKENVFRLGGAAIIGIVGLGINVLSAFVVMWVK